LFDIYRRAPLTWPFYPPRQRSRFPARETRAHDALAARYPSVAITLGLGAELPSGVTPRVIALAGTGDRHRPERATGMAGIRTSGDDVPKPHRITP
jgi:hypothetical protein